MARLTDATVPTETDRLAFDSPEAVAEHFGIEIDPETAASLLRIRLIAQLRRILDAKGWSGVEAAAALDVPAARISEIQRGKYHLFSIDRLVTFISRAGGQVDVTVTSPELETA